jgi:hypothetical protein
MKTNYILQLKVQTILLGHSLKEINGRVFFVPVGPYDSVRFCIKNYTLMAVYTIQYEMEKKTAKSNW